MQRDSQRVFDEFLVAAAITGDAEAWRRLVQRWQPKLLRHAWRLLSDTERAQDSVQEAWLEILRGLVRLQDAAAFPAWALQIVTRRCNRRIPESIRERHQGAIEELDADPGDQPLTPAIENHVDLGIVLSALQQLPAPQRATLALFYLDDLSVAEIAVALDVPPGTVKTRLMHARRNLRARLEGAGDEQI